MGLRLVAFLPDGRQTWDVSKGETTIGRDVGNGVVLPFDSVSRFHARLVHNGNHLEVLDLDSRNGTTVNDQTVHGRHPLHAGDRLRFGNIEAQVDSGEAHADTRPTPVQQYDWGDVLSLPPASRDPGGVVATLRELGAFLVRRHGRDEIYDAVLERVYDLVGYELACLFLLTDAGLREVRRRAVGREREPRFSHSLLDKAVRDRAPLLVTDRINLTDSMHRERIRSALAVPLFDHTKVIGVLYLDSRRSGHIYTEEDLRRVEILATVLALKLTNSELTEELEKAKGVQEALLPATILAPPGYEGHGRLAACTSVAGDLYDVLPLADGRCAIALGDVSGTGLGASLLSATVLATLRAVVGQTTDALELIRQMESQLRTCWGEQGYVTLFTGILDSNRHLLHYVNAGHGGALLVLTDGTIRMLSPTGAPLGMRIGVPFEAASVELPPGALLCMWSDGFEEAHRTDVVPLRFYGDEQVLETFRELRAAPLTTVAHELFSRVDAFLGDSPAPDDRTLLLLRRDA